MKKYLIFIIFPLLILSQCFSPARVDVGTAIPTMNWPDTLPWWKVNNLRVIQTNLPAYEAGLDADSLVQDLIRFSANTLIINAGGIMAFYPTKLDCQYTNPYMKEDMLGDVISGCHKAGIKVIVRFDFSRAHKSIFEKHPEWFYISPKGERIINDEMYAVSMNGGYEQDCMFRIVEEVIDTYPVDGIFLNMPGYQTRNAYVGVYHGIDQNDSEKKAFAAFSNGMRLPLEENSDDPVFRKYQEFKNHTTEELMRRLHALVKSKNEQIAICTYSEKYVDIIRHESQTNTLPYWPYNASDNVNNTRHSYPDHIVSNASIQQISFQSRYNAIEPEEVTIRLYENIANGSGLDLSLMGDFQGYEDERNYDAFRNVYGFHKRHEPYFGRYTSPAEIAVISPGAWPSGEPAQEYRGIQLMLKEAHLQYDIIEAGQLGNRSESLRKYKLVILPEIVSLDARGLEALTSACRSGVSIIATNRSLSAHAEILSDLFGARATKTNHDGTGYYLHPDDHELFKRLEGQSLVFWKFNLGLYDFTGASASHLPIFTPGRPGPPESIGGHEPSGHFAVGIKNHGDARAVLVPINLGRLYYLHGYEQHKNILLDIIEHVFPASGELIKTNAHPRVEVVLQNYVRNIPGNLSKTEAEGMILHLVNITGFSGNTYFEPLPVSNLSFDIACPAKPRRVFSLSGERQLDFTWDAGRLVFVVDELAAFDGIVIELG